MKTPFLLILLAFITVCPSCGSMKDSYRRSSYIGENPELTTLQRDDIREGRIHVGMTREMVRASRGEPTETSAKTAFTGTVEEKWFYDEGDETLTVEFQNGRVAGWTEKRKEEEK